MKRDMDLVREILLALEAEEPGAARRGALQVEGYDEQTVAEHVRLLAEAGLIEALVKPMLGGKLVAYAKRLTWEGHDFLADARSDTVWKRAKAVIAEKGADVSLAVMRAVLSDLGKRHILGSP